jgi:ElaB/YqjD/DUF883 family membrane-anchored ribosome-binding protein
MNKDGTAGNGMDAIKEGVRGLVDQGQQKVDEIKHRVVEVKDQAMSRGTQVVDRVTDFIKANPLKAVGIAFGAGYIGMRLFRR